MRFWMLFLGAVALGMGCGDGDIGDDCNDDDDCEDGLFCDFTDPAAEPGDGICRDPLTVGDDDDDSGN